jgi:hypothetical protein
VHYVSCMGKIRTVYKILVTKPRETTWETTHRLKESKWILGRCELIKLAQDSAQW